MKKFLQRTFLFSIVAVSGFNLFVFADPAPVERGFASKCQVRWGSPGSLAYKRCYLTCFSSELGEDVCGAVVIPLSACRQYNGAAWEGYCQFPPVSDEKLCYLVDPDSPRRLSYIRVPWSITHSLSCVP